MHVFCIFCAILFAFFLNFLCVLFCDCFLCFQGNAQQMQKKSQKKTQIQSNKNAKAKTRTFLIACVLLFDCMFFIFCAFFSFFVRLLHWFSGQMRGFRFFFSLFCIPRRPLVTCFCVFCAFCSGLVLHYFCIVYAFFLKMFCCVIRTSFSVHHKPRGRKSDTLLTGYWMKPCQKRDEDLDSTTLG